MDAKRLLILLFFTIQYYFLEAQCAKQLVSFNCSACKIEKILDALENQVSCSFSFNASQFDLDEQTTLNVQDTPLSKALKLVLGQDISLDQKGRHLIILPSNARTKTPKKEQNYIIEGVVRNQKTGELIHKATVYCIDNKYTAVTNERGEFKFNLQEPLEQVGISVSKQSYFDTIIIVRPNLESSTYNIKMEPKQSLSKMPTKKARIDPIKEVESLPMVRMLVPERQSLLARNLEWLEHIPAQISLIPSVGTNKLSSGISSNAFSINVFSGYNSSLTGLELGGINILRKDAHGFQSGYLGNIVGGKLKGIQIGGIFNNVRGSISGLQVGGIYNVVLDTIVGVQIGGVFNVLKGNVTGSQIAGIFNLATENMAGFQCAGITNVTTKDVKVAQAAGVVNVAQNVSGVQIGGIINVASGNVKGIQIGGLINVAQDVSGTQLAGLVNRSEDAHTQIGFINKGKTINGSQVGFINIADSSKFSFGFLSFSKKGFHCVDITADELHFFNASVRTGVQKFYNIFHFGYGSYLQQSIYSYGYGVGIAFPSEKKRTSWNLDFMARQVENTQQAESYLNLDVKIQPHLVVRIGKKRPSIVLGGSIHGLISTGAPYAGNSFISTSYPPIFQPIEGVVAFKPWVGFNAGIRF